MKNNVLKKLMVLGIGSMLLMGSSVSANEFYEHTHWDNNSDHICDDENCKESLFVLDMVIPATCTNDGHTDLKCIACGHRMTGEIFPATGHSDTDNDHYCNNINIRRGNVICNEKISDCSGGTATCKDRAFCEVCGKPYGDVDSAIHAGGTELRNDKPATCTENGYTGDTYCKGCGTKLLDGTVIPATEHIGGLEVRLAKDPTCTEDGYTGNTYCIDCYTLWDDGSVIPATGHNDTDNDHYCNNKLYGTVICNEKISDCSGGTATCVNQAICDTCGNSYGEVDPDNHVGDTEIRDARKAICIADGYTGDTYCTSCDTKLLDGTIIPATEHFDTDDHFCDYYCGEQLSKCSGGTATCVSRAICEHCGEEYGGVDSNNHVGELTIQNNKEATCTEDGYSGDTYCESCNNVVETGSELPRLGHIDEDTNHICDRETCGKVLSECTGGEATCNDLGVCEYCGREYGEKDMNNHVGDTEIRDAKEATCTEEGYTGDTYCVSCETKLLDGTVIPALGHKGGAATCKDQAICEYCNNVYGELNTSNHVGDTEIRDAKPATCCEDGYTGDTYCTSCDTKLLDGTIIPATGHVDNDDNNKCDTCGIIINETEPETEPITEKEKPAKKKETEKQTESKPVVEETESNLPEAPKTGDNTPVIALFSLLLGSIAIIFGCITCRGRKED